MPTIKIILDGDDMKLLENGQSVIINNVYAGAKLDILYEGLIKHSDFKFICTNNDGCKIFMKNKIYIVKDMRLVNVVSYNSTHQMSNLSSFSTLVKAYPKSTFIEVY